MKSWILWILPIASAFAQQAAVKAESAAIYPRQQISEETVSTLKRGDLVFVEFAINSPDGEWCQVRHLKGDARGYMRCVQLDRKRDETTYILVQTEVSPAPEAGKATPAAGEDRHQVKYVVEGNGLTMLTYQNESGRTEQTTVDLPWTLVLNGKRGKFLYLAAHKQPIPRRRLCEQSDNVMRPDDCFDYERLLRQSFLPIKTTIFLDERVFKTAETNARYGVVSIGGSIP